MSSKDFVDLGTGVVRRMTAKAAMIDLQEHGAHWFPFSGLAAMTLKDCADGVIIEHVKVEAWLVRKEELDQ